MTTNPNANPASPNSTEEPAPYGSGPTTDATVRKVRTHHIAKWKNEGHKWAMLTCYDQYMAQIFDDAGIPVFLVGDSAANNVYGYESSLPVTVDELLVLVKAVTRSSRRALVVADLPFGSYQRDPEQAYDTSVRFMKEGLAHAVKLEGGSEMTPQIRKLTEGGIPVVAHIGFTPQSEHALGGYRIQGRGDARQKLIDDALAVQAAGAFAVVMEMVPESVATEITGMLDIATIGIGAGAGCDAQVLVWQDMLGLRTGKAPRFVKRYADLHSVVDTAVRQFAAEVAEGTFPAAEHSFED